jgi:uncharacterized membrane-anchored protein
MKKNWIIIPSVFLPTVASAATLGSIISSLQGSISGAVGLLSGLAIIFFLYGMVRYLYSLGKGKEEGKEIMWKGVIALFVMFAVWGLVGVISGTLGIPTGGSAP